ncbi:hypothetical protein B0O99DRAFT_682230 [Bisporella sp. PMI_857]|nr:hypothetical protein B0O99DRAFT_590683 [Bisporella sp. PMI_857]KAH8600540.1 hypothetical protein B0O99DRAFT_682230 [Bisporella sp. PMI_857]
MAEVLGVIASGITVVEVVGKIGGRILALKKLWDEVQDVPDKIAELMRDIEILEPLLTELESNLTDANTIGSNSGSIGIALTYCQKAMVNLDALLKDLAINLLSHRESRAEGKQN